MILMTAEFGLDFENLFSVSMLLAKSGALIDQQVVTFVSEWARAKEHMAALCCDTTASNTGIN